MNNRQLDEEAIFSCRSGHPRTRLRRSDGCLDSTMRCSPKKKSTKRNTTVTRNRVRQYRTVCNSFYVNHLRADTDFGDYDKTEICLINGLQAAKPT